MTRDEITQNKLRRYRRIWGLFLNLPVRTVAAREGVSQTRIRQIVAMYARVIRYRLRRQTGDVITGENWSAHYAFPYAIDCRVAR